MSHVSGGCLLLLVACSRDHFVDAGNKDTAVGSDEFAHENNEVGHGLMHRASKRTRVEVARRTRDGELEVGEPAETVSQAWGTGVQPVVVRLGKYQSAR